MFALFASGSLPVTVAVFVIIPVAVGVTERAIVAVAEEANAPRLHVRIDPLREQVP